MVQVGELINLLANAPNQVNSIWSAIGFAFSAVTDVLLVILQIFAFYHPQLQGNPIGDVFFYILRSYGAVVWVAKIASRLTRG